jgi:hypothetical protein
MTALTMVYQLQDKIDVAHFLDLQFQDIAHLPLHHWNELRTYAVQNGLPL